MKALIDLDIITYRAGFSGQKTRHQYSGEKSTYLFDRGITKTQAIDELKNKGEVLIDDNWTECIEVERIEIVLHNAKTMISAILKETEANDYMGYLSSSEMPLTRASYATIQPYKGNRKTFLKPYYYNEIREYLQNNYKCRTVMHIEADDALAADQTEDTIICSIDKDLLQIPGKHYNFVKKEFQDITELEGHRNLYKQVLMGDRADNIPGIMGIGEVKANKILKTCHSQSQIHQTVAKMYLNTFESGQERFSEILKLCYLLREYKDYEYT